GGSCCEAYTQCRIADLFGVQRLVKSFAVEEADGEGGGRGRFLIEGGETELDDEFDVGGRVFGGEGPEHAVQVRRGRLYFLVLDFLIDEPLREFREGHELGDQILVAHRFG